MNAGSYYFYGSWITSQTVTTCTIYAFCSDSTMLTSIKTNFIAFSKTLADNKLIEYSYFTNYQDANCPACDGRSSILTCPCDKSIASVNLASLNYKIFI